MGKNKLFGNEEEEITPDPPEETKPEAPGAKLVRMSKAGEFSDVHPDTVKSHEQAGWKVEK